MKLAIFGTQKNLVSDNIFGQSVENVKKTTKNVAYLATKDVAYLATKNFAYLT